jgi:excisionase family DNA binding protein
VSGPDAQLAFSLVRALPDEALIAMVAALPDTALDALEERLNARRTLGTSPWLNAEEAAAYVRCPVSRIRKLTSTRELPAHRDGRRVLYRSDELDGFIRRGGARSP